MHRSRVVLATSAATAAALVLAGCGGADEEEAAAEGGGGGSLTFTSYGSAYQDAQNTAWVEPWSAESGVEVTNDSPTDYARIKAMVDAGEPTWDVVDTEPYFPISVCGTYAEELDLSRFDVESFPEGTVSDCAVPVLQYSTILAYQDSAYPDGGPTSWADFFDTERFPGTRMVPNFASGGALEAALLADGIAADDLYPLDYERAFAKLDTLGDDLQYWDTSSASQQALEEGTADMAIVWSGRAYEATKNGAAVTPVWDQNLLAWATLMIVKGSPNKDAAMDFLVHATQPEAQAALAELQPYSAANLEAAPELDELQQQYDVSVPEVQDQAVVTDAQWWADNQDEANAEWLAWTTG